ncbi:hypothetical protein F5883DRAFT_700652 [Diaporthe sp. PMI_573]|jgi:hypothetical protein|nr:hypothetical protein F5883DRAFT_700652 [Diaporthaceae sp. PMI_573]
MAGVPYAAGPEWSYLALRTRSHGPPTDLDSLFVNVIVQRQLAKPDTETKVLNLQTLITKQGLGYGPHDVTRFSFARLRELTRSGDLDLFFYEDAVPGVAIPDEASFQRLLLAVRHLGLAGPQSPGERIYAPPVLRFFARPKPPPPSNPLVDAILVFLILLGFVVVFILLWDLELGPVVVGLIIIGTLVKQSANENRRR